MASPTVDHQSRQHSLRSRQQAIQPLILRLLFELLVVFVGVFGALWVGSRKENNERRARAFRVADAISAEIIALNIWYRPWRDTVGVNYREWRKSVEEGKRPPPYFFRVPGSEHLPTVGWQVAVQSGILDILPPAFVFEIGNIYSEWSDIGDRIARYHASTEAIVFPLIGTQLVGTLDYGVDSHRQWSERLSSSSTPAAYDANGRLLPLVAANVALMEDILTQMDSRYDMALEMKVRLDSAVAALRR